MNMFILIFYILFFSLNVDAHGRPLSFSFDQTDEDWGSWGTGLGSHDADVGYKQKGSLWLSVDWGEIHSFHYSWAKLKPGNYKVTAYVRAQDVQPDIYGYSFWHFYDAGNGIKDVFLNLHGSYEWRKIEYTVYVKNKLTIWFRLKSPGQVWVDDISIVQSSEKMEQVKIEPQKTLNKKHERKVKGQKKSKSVTLLDFDHVNPIHPFSVIKMKNGSQAGKLISGHYYNLDPQHYLQGNWADFERIEFDIYNGNDYFTELYFVLSDQMQSNYWGQLNHKTHLAPGHNHLSFSLSQFLGERGSHRYLRPVHLEKIKRIFFVIDPNKKNSESSRFFIDNIKLSFDPYPDPPDGVYAFDFTSQKDFTQNGFQKVTSQDLYQTNGRFGFVHPKYWRVEDSGWAPHILRYSIGLTEGHFKVKLPNGNYQMQIIIDRLGFWDPSFWKDRTLYINDKVVFKEARSYANDFLQDLLQFENIIPSNRDHPYDLYLKKIFRPLEFSFNVTQGVLDLKFEGDPTGIGLNTLVIWDRKHRKSALEFLEKIEDTNRKELSYLTRPIHPHAEINVKRPHIATLIESKLNLGPYKIENKIENEINLQGGRGEKPFQMIQLSGVDSVKWEFRDFKASTGNIFPRKDIHFYQVIPQYISPDLNHETYMIAGKYLKKINNEFNFNKNELGHLLFAVKINKDVSPGIYSGFLKFTSKNQKIDFPVSIKVLDYDLPKVDFPVGFFGLDPLPITYFSDPEMSTLRRKFRLQALKKLGEDGFTTFSGLPDVKMKINDNQWSLDTTELDEVVAVAESLGMSQIYFSYGGKFPHSLLDKTQIPYGISENIFFEKLTPLLRNYLDKKLKATIVHTFSDEAGGYSNREVEDIQIAKELKNKFPFLKRGGFSTLSEKFSLELKDLFDYGFYSQISKNQLKQLPKKNKWGSYNASPGNLDDPRFSFGPGLYYARSKGLSYYLEWHSSSISNYPYYDLDGRESDVAMFMPSTTGELRPSLRYLLSVQGLHSLRKLFLLDQAINKEKGSLKSRIEAGKWLNQIKDGQLISAENILLPSQGHHFNDFHRQLDAHLSNLYLL